MNSKYNEGRNALALALVDLSSDTLVLYALDATYAAIAWDPVAGTFDGVDHDFSDLIGVLDSETLTTQVVSAEGWVTSDPVVFTGLAVAEDTACFVLRDTTADVLLAFYDNFVGFQPIALTGDGNPVTINPPASGWYRT